MNRIYLFVASFDSSRNDGIHSYYAHCFKLFPMLWKRLTIWCHCFLSFARFSAHVQLHMIPRIAFSYYSRLFWCYIWRNCKTQPGDTNFILNFGIIIITAIVNSFARVGLLLLLCRKQKTKTYNYYCWCSEM